MLYWLDKTVRGCPIPPTPQKTKIILSLMNGHVHGMNAFNAPHDDEWRNVGSMVDHKDLLWGAKGSGGFRYRQFLAISAVQVQEKGLPGASWPLPACSSCGCG